MSSRPKAHLHWATTNHQPCFCNPVIYIDLTKLAPTSETIAAIFGVYQPESIELRSYETQDLVPCDERGIWKLEPEQNYQVHVGNSSDDTTKDKVIPIQGIFALLPGDTDDEKSDCIQRLSETFYDKIWNDPATPVEFRNLLYSLTSSASIQAFRQYDWFHEVFGGPTMARQRRDKMLLPKVMAKHTASRMTRAHAMTWLHIMKQSVQVEFPNHPQLQSSLGLYWLHFFGFFPYTDEDRKEFRSIVFGD
jgi:truncated hemoglobin YjbI